MRAIRMFSAVTATAVCAALLVGGVASSTAAHAAPPVAGDPLSGTGVTKRVSDEQKPTGVFQPSYTTDPGGVVADPTASFGIPAEAAPPLHEFNRTLRINDVVLTDWSDVPLATPVGTSSVYVDGFDYYAEPLTWAQFLPYTNWEVTGATPADGQVHYYLEQQFVQHGSHLIPTVRGLQSPGEEVAGSWRGSQDYNIIWGIGRAWSETSDVLGADSASRASVPFTLVNQEENCSFNGLLTFLFTDTGVSRVHYQVASETCAYFKGNMWGNLPGVHTGDEVDPAAAEAIRVAYNDEVQQRMPTKPIAQLAIDYPGFDLSAFDAGTTPAHTTAYGFVYKGVNYVSDCVVRTSNDAGDAAGVHPFCDQVHLPSYSTAKSIFVGGALLRLAEKFGVGVYEERVSDWVPELAEVSSWDDVTFNDIVDMATGHYDSSGNQVDEAGARMAEFFSFTNRTRASVMNEATGFPSVEAPGQRWVYHSSDSFILAAAMDAYLKGQTGGNGDIYAMLFDEVLAPIGVSPDSQTTERTKLADAAAGNRQNPSGIPWGGYGLWWNQDNLAKIGDFFTNSGGALNGTQLLEQTGFVAAMQRDEADRGFNTAGEIFQYNNGFWARPFNAVDNAEFTTDFYVPFMSGYGGITVAHMPNCSTFYRVSDGYEFAWASIVSESHKIDSMVAPTDESCAAAAPADPEDGAADGGADGPASTVPPASPGADPAVQPVGSRSEGLSVTGIETAPMVAGIAGVLLALGALSVGLARVRRNLRRR